MQQEVTSDELRIDYERAMGAELGLLCYELRDEVDWLTGKWKEFEELFDKGEERILILNKSAPNFFYFLKKVMFEDAILHLCRLTDHPQTVGQANLTLMRLESVISDPGLRSRVTSGAQHARTKCEFARKWRDKRLAHTDLYIQLNKQLSGLPVVQSTHIKDAIKCFDSLLLEIELHHGIRPAVLTGDPWGAKPLMHLLKVGLRAEEGR